MHVYRGFSIDWFASSGSVPRTSKKKRSNQSAGNFAIGARHQPVREVEMLLLVVCTEDPPPPESVSDGSVSARFQQEESRPSPPAGGGGKWHHYASAATVFCGQVQDWNGRKRTKCMQKRFFKLSGTFQSNLHNIIVH